MNKLKEVYLKVKGKVALGMAIVTTTVMCNPSLAFAGQIHNSMNKASNDMHSEAVSALKPILTLVLVAVGLILFFGGERGKETAKSKIGVAVIGVALILWAPNIINMLLGWFK